MVVSQDYSQSGDEAAVVSFQAEMEDAALAAGVDLKMAAVVFVRDEASVDETSELAVLLH